jgi:hypothetical protein
LKKIRKPTSDYFGLRALERIILREMEASEEPTEKRKGPEPPEHLKKTPEPNPEITAKSTEKETTDGPEDRAEYESIFTEEERKFISEAIEWLGARENKDLILHQIMGRIDEVKPFPAAKIQPHDKAACDAEAGAH